MPAMNDDDREKQLTGLAMNLAEKQLREGTASAQVIVHFLKLGSSKEKTDKELKKEQTELCKAKKKAYDAAETSGQAYEDALKAFSTYKTGGDSEVYDE